MWDREEFDVLSPRRIELLESLAAVWPSLAGEIADELDRRAEPHVACFFQLPFQVRLESGWHEMPVLERNVRAKMRAIPTCLLLDERGRSSILPAEDLAEGACRGAGKVPVTQMVVLVPLWGRRLDFYEAYRACLTDKGIRDKVIVPAAQSWMDGQPMRVAEFESSICHRMPRELLTLLRRLLPAYSVLTLTVAPQPEWLSALFVMSAPGRLIFNRMPEALIRRVVRTSGEPNTELVGSDKLRGATDGPLRELTRFEQQLLAVNRLRMEGEAALALIGTLSLLEWFVTAEYRALQEYGRQPSLSFIMTKTPVLSFIDEGTRDALLRAIEVRHRYTHGSPPIRESMTVGLGKAAGRERDTSGDELAVTAERTIRAAFSVYRAVNIERASGRKRA
jgi:hypothetical protein